MDLKNLQEQFQNPEDVTDWFAPEDIQNNKVSAVFACFPILFWLPLVIAQNSPYAKFCANQGLIYFTMDMVLSAAVSLLGAVLGFIPLIGGLISVLLGLASSLAMLACFVFLLINAVQGKAKKIPVIGNLFTAFK